MTLEAADTGDSEGEGAAGDADDDEDDDGEAEDMEQFQESGLLDEVDPVSGIIFVAFCFFRSLIRDVVVTCGVVLASLQGLSTSSPIPIQCKSFVFSFSIV